MHTTVSLGWISQTTMQPGSCGVCLTAVALVLAAAALAFVFNRHKRVGISMYELVYALEQMVYVLVWDKQSAKWVVRDCSQGCQAIFGHTREEMKYTTFDIMDHIHPEDGKRIHAMATMTFPIGFKFVFEMRCRGRFPESEYTWVRSKALLRSEDDVEQVWLGMFDDISDLKETCCELDRSRSHITALEAAVTACFEQSFYLDENFEISASPWESQSGAPFSKLLISQTDMANFAKYISGPLSEKLARRPVMVDLNLFSEEDNRAYCYNVMAIRVPFYTDSRRILIGLRKSVQGCKLQEIPPNVCCTLPNRRLIDVQIEGDIESVAGFIYQSLPEDRQTQFGELWRAKACIEDVVECLYGASRSLGVRFAVAMAQLVVLSLMELRVPVLDKCKLLVNCLERSLTLPGDRGAQVCFRLALCGLRLADVSCTNAAYFFDVAFRLLTDAGPAHVFPASALQTMASLLCIQRGIHSAKAGRQDEGVNFLDRAVGLASVCEDDASIQVVALAMYNSFVVTNDQRRLSSLRSFIGKFRAEVTFDSEIFNVVSQVSPF